MFNGIDYYNKMVVKDLIYWFARSDYHHNYLMTNEVDEYYVNDYSNLHLLNQKKIEVE